MKLYRLDLLQEQYLPFLSTFYVTLRSILQFIVIFSLCLPLPSLSCSLALSGKLFSAHRNTEKKPTSRKPHQTLPMGHLFIVLLEREDMRWGASSSAGHFEGRSPSRGKACVLQHRLLGTLPHEVNQKSISTRTHSKDTFDHCLFQTKIRLAFSALIPEERFPT